GPSDYAFKAERTLSDGEIATLQKWVEAGMPEGDPKKLPAIPPFTEGWQLGTPDLVVAMDEGFEVPAYGRDIYRNFVLPLNLSEDKWVSAVDFRPSARGVVHHSLFYLDDTGTARTMAGKDGRPGFNGAMGGGVAITSRVAGRGNNMNDLLNLLMGNRPAGDASGPDIGEI